MCGYLEVIISINVRETIQKEGLKGYVHRKEAIKSDVLH